MKAWDEKAGDFVDLDKLEAKPQPKYVQAYYKPVEDGFLTPEQKTQQEQPHNEPVAEKSTPVAAYEYNIEIACPQEDIVTYQIGAFSLGKTNDEPVISAWQKSASQTGFTLLTASVMVNEPKALYREFFQSSGSALAFQDVNPVKKGSGTHTESFVPIKTAVQVGEQLGWPTIGFYYHFIDDKLTHEYQIVGNDASTFFATQSSAEQLSSSLLSDHQYNFILLPWKVNNASVTRQHLLYLPQKMTKEEFAELSGAWLDENACLLDVEMIVKSKNENVLAREKTEGDEVTYVIQPNDSLSKIAHQQGTTLENLVELNPQYKGKEGQIQIGDMLIIESNKDESTHISAHIVVLNGDGNRETWDEIAKQHCMAPKELLTLNSMFEDNPSALKVGDELCINAPQQAQDKAQRITLPPIVLTHIGQVSSFVNSFSSMSKRLLNAFVVAALSDKNIPANTPIVNVGKKTLRSTELSSSNDLELLANGKGEFVKIKAESESVKVIQKALLKLNFDLGSAGADGKFGSGTESVIKTFQSTYTSTNKIHADYKIGSADGIVGKNTLLALDEAVVGKWVVVIKEQYNWADSSFGDTLGFVESKNDYTAYNKTKGGLRAFFNTNLTTMTVAEVMEQQKQRNMFAVGRFQIITSTLSEAVSALNIKLDSLFDKKNQDYIFNNYLISKKRPEIINYLEGKGTVEDAMYAWAKEFASAGVEKGRKISKGRAAEGGESYYSGDGLNKAHLTPEKMKATLIKAKQER